MAFYLCVVLAAIGASELVKEGPNDRPNAEHSNPDTRAYTVEPDRHDISTVETTEAEEVDVSNVPSVPGWDGNRISPGDDVPGMVEPTETPREEPTLVGEIDVVPAGEPTSEAVAAPVPAVGIEGIVCAYDWDCATAMRIVSCETGGTFDPYCVGAAGERGWFQIHPIHWSKPQCSGDLFDPAYNTACAYSIWVGQGWWPWSCY